MQGDMTSSSALSFGVADEHGRESEESAETGFDPRQCCFSRLPLSGTAFAFCPFTMLSTIYDSMLTPRIAYKHLICRHSSIASNFFLPAPLFFMKMFLKFGRCCDRLLRNRPVLHRFDSASKI
jgi:hypothetical protein